MCDTMVALGDATADGSVIFAKNSDRPPNEAHQLFLVPRATHSPGSTVQCTYIQIPQVPKTHTVLLAKPFWIWGAEMGTNEFGVTIGNEAVFTKVPYDKDPGLLGMDFLRLALERSSSACEALDTITALLEVYGQGGNCSFDKRMYYHNSYIIADPQEAWVLETAGRHWAAEKVTGIRSISNAITIGAHWDRASYRLVDHAVEKGWCRNRAEFHFGRCYSDNLFTKSSDAHKRRNRTTTLLTQHRGRISVKTLMQLLRDHGDVGPYWNPSKGLLGSTVCMHAGAGPIRISQTTGSMVSHLTPKTPTHWVTGTSAPCISVFKPIWLDAGLPDLGPTPTQHYDRASLFWRHEALHHEVLRDYSQRLQIFQKERDEHEEHFIKEACRLQNALAAERFAFSKQCFERGDQAREQWLEKVTRVKPSARLSWFYSLIWRNHRKKSGLKTGKEIPGSRLGKLKRLLF